MMKHRYSKSLKLLLKEDPGLYPSKSSLGNFVEAKLPFILTKSTKFTNETNQISRNKNSQSSLPSLKKQDQRLDSLVEKVQQKAKFLSILKSKLLQINDNILNKKIMFQIKNSSLGRVAVDIWQNVRQYQTFNLEKLNTFEEKSGKKIDDNFLGTMDFINNVCKFTYAEYKKKRWQQKQQQIAQHFQKIRISMKEVTKKVAGIQTPQTKVQIVNSLRRIQGECIANNPRYLDWKQRAIQKLKEKQIRDEILKAQIFVQGFI